MLYDGQFVFHYTYDALAHIKWTNNPVNNRNWMKKKIKTIDGEEKKELLNSCSSTTFSHYFLHRHFSLGFVVAVRTAIPRAHQKADKSDREQHLKEIKSTMKNEEQQRKHLMILINLPSTIGLRNRCSRIFSTLRPAISPKERLSYNSI